MAEARRMGKSALFSYFAERFDVKRTQSREFFDELQQLSEKELNDAASLCCRHGEAGRSKPESPDGT